MRRRKSNLWDSLLPAAKEQVKLVEEEDSHIFADRNLTIQRNLEVLEKKSVQGVLGMKIKELSLAKVYLSYGTEYKEKLEKIADNLYQPKAFVDSTEKITNIRDKYFENPDRANRLIFLHNYLSTNHQRQETVTFDHDEVRAAQKIPERDYIRFLSPVLPDELEFLVDKKIQNRPKTMNRSTSLKRDRK
ncbi:hypothetical protein HDV01_004451 [Terramyces sp. JEL0728]|nr:hypothetical protein HDV01_004451 [Terramyces sp. JEL0728]